VEGHVPIISPQQADIEEKACLVAAFILP